MRDKIFGYMMDYTDQLIAAKEALILFTILANIE
jgi:hypothetical protein